MKDLLFISDYDSGYYFSVMWDGKIYDNGGIYDICYRHMNELSNEMYGIWYERTGKLNFKPLRKALQDINICPKEIIIFSDGSIYRESENESEVNNV